MNADTLIAKLNMLGYTTKIVKNTKEILYISIGSESKFDVVGIYDLTNEKWVAEIDKSSISFMGYCIDDTIPIYNIDYKNGSGTVVIENDAKVLADFLCDKVCSKIDIFSLHRKNMSIDENKFFNKALILKNKSSYIFAIYVYNKENNKSVLEIIVDINELYKEYKYISMNIFKNNYKYFYDIIFNDSRNEIGRISFYFEDDIIKTETKDERVKLVSINRKYLG